MLYDRFMFFSPIELKFFFWANNEMTNNLCVCDSVIWSFCDQFRDVPIPKFQPIPEQHSIIPASQPCASERCSGVHRVCARILLPHTDKTLKII